MKVAVYTRKSVYKEGAISIDTQIKLCKEYILRDNPKAEFEIFEDEGFSGKNTNRPAFKKMLSLIKLGIFNTVICYKIDRLARNTLDFLKTFEFLKENNVSLVSVSDGIDPNTSVGVLQLTLLAAFAQMERENIQIRVSDNLLELAKSGKWTGGSAPIGYIQTSKGTLEIENEDMIKDIFRMKYENKSVNEIIDTIDLNYNYKFSHSNVLNSVLRKPIHVKSSIEVSQYLRSKGYKVIGEEDGLNGYYNYKDKTGDYRIVGNVKACIEPNKWLRINMDMDRLNKRENSKFSKDFYLTKTLVCPECGGTYLGCTKTWSKKYTLKDNTEKEYKTIVSYYHCRNNAKGKLKTCGNNKNIRKEKIESTIDELMLSLQDISNFESLYNSSKQTNNRNEIKALNTKIKTIEKNINGLMDKVMLLSVEASKVFLNKIEELTLEKTNLITRRTDLEIEDMTISSNTKESTYSKILQYNKDMSIEEKREILMYSFDKIIYNPKTETLEIFLV
ncbi:MAG: putative resolvase [Anaerocolumna sp.]|jgi:DNA invertase Pin-like site-specific DNA recombinase|nr:putative resolvase [Anaerocolumna sp.]